MKSKTSAAWLHQDGEFTEMFLSPLEKHHEGNNLFLFFDIFISVRSKENMLFRLGLYKYL